MEKENYIEHGAEVISMFCRLYMNTKKDLPVRSSHMGLLILSVKGERPLTPIEAAKFFQVKKPMITAMVKSLEKGGYLIKQPSSSDRRSYLLVPTQKGISLVEKTYDEYFRIIDTLYGQMKANDFEKMISLLEVANHILLKGRN